MLARIVTVTLLSLVLGAGAPPPAGRLPAAIEDAIQQVSVAELRAHIEVLASDRLAGRGLGHAGNHEAERYITDALRAGGFAVSDLEAHDDGAGHAQLVRQGEHGKVGASDPRSDGTFRGGRT